MRKIFLDCGANMGQSIKQFVDSCEDPSEYEIYSFECTTSDIIIKSWIEIANSVAERVKSITLLKKAVWIENGEITFYDAKNESSSVLREKIGAGYPVSVKSIDLSNFIFENFSKDDYIVLKIDIEGAEYSVFNKLFETGIINYINKLYGELHGPKCGVAYSEDLKLINKLRDVNLPMYYWDATNDKEISNKIYDEESLYNFHKKYNFCSGK